MTCESLPASELQHRKQLRTTLRQRRRALTPQQQQQAAQKLSRKLQKLPQLKHAQNIAAYVASDGEIDPSVFLAWAQQRGKTIWLPVVCDDHPLHPLGLRFVVAPMPKQRGGWRRNRYGIAEPRSRRQIAPGKLDLLLLPLVGFDHQGNRLGMGGGYYDRLLHALEKTPRHPQYIGLAHRCQSVPQLASASWDKPVDRVIAV
ncbi:MAG: 5-formyltetrahydrofolate cyclo-ligase [Pseudomonadota bacterium]